MKSDFDVDKFLADLGVKNSPAQSMPTNHHPPPLAAYEYLKIIEAVNVQAAKIFEQQIAMIERFSKLLKK